MDKTKPPNKRPPNKRLQVQDLIVTFVSPMLVGKVLVLYFGQHYSQYPGEGYGIGLGIAIVFTLAMFLRFIWRYRDYTEDEER